MRAMVEENCSKQKWLRIFARIFRSKSKKQRRRITFSLGFTLQTRLRSQQPTLTAPRARAPEQEGRHTSSHSLPTQTCTIYTRSRQRQQLRQKHKHAAGTQQKVRISLVRGGDKGDNERTKHAQATVVPPRAGRCADMHGCGGGTLRVRHAPLQ